MISKFSCVKYLNEYVLSRYIKKGDLVRLPFFGMYLVKVDEVRDDCILCGGQFFSYGCIFEIYRKKYIFSKPRLMWSHSTGFVD